MIEYERIDVSEGTDINKSDKSKECMICHLYDLYDLFQRYFRYWLGRRSVDDKRQIARWKGIVARYKDKLVKMIKDANGRFDYYSISPKIRPILLHWGYELVEIGLL